MSTDQPEPTPQTPEDQQAEASAAEQSGEVSKEDRTMGMLAHLLGIFTGFIGPLVIWLIKKDQSAFVDDQAKEALNFQITLLIAYAVAGITSCIVIGVFLIPVILIVQVVLGILATMAANSGRWYRYPFAIRLIK